MSERMVSDEVSCKTLDTDKDVTPKRWEASEPVIASQMSCEFPGLPKRSRGSRRPGRLLKKQLRQGSWSPAQQAATQRQGQESAGPSLSTTHQCERACEQMPQRAQGEFPQPDWTLLKDCVTSVGKTVELLCGTGERTSIIPELESWGRRNVASSNWGMPGLNTTRSCFKKQQKKFFLKLWLLWVWVGNFLKTSFIYD